MVAGYVAPAKVWRTFSIEWQTVLDKRPKLKYFHTVEANSRTGAFSNWDAWPKEKIEERAQELARIVECHADQLIGILCVVREREFRALVPPALFGYPYSDPYHFCFNRVIMSTRQARDERNLRDKVKFIFDNQNRLGFDVRGELPKMLKYVESQERGFIAGAPSFEDDKDAVPLQAADMVAWHLRYHSIKGIDPAEGSVLSRLMKPGFNAGWWSPEAWAWMFALPMLLMYFAGKPGSPEEMRKFGAGLRDLWQKVDKLYEQKAKDDHQDASS